METKWSKKLEFGRNYHGRQLTATYAIEAAIVVLGLDEWDGRHNVYGVPSVILYGMPDSEEIKRLLPLVGKFDKGYDSDTNQLTLKATCQGVAITFKAAPPDTCTVEMDEEEVEVPEEIVEAHTETRRTYRLVGDCPPMTQPKELKP